MQTLTILGLCKSIHDVDNRICYSKVVCDGIKLCTLPLVSLLGWCKGFSGHSKKVVVTMDWEDEDDMCLYIQAPKQVGDDQSTWLNLYIMHSRVSKDLMDKVMTTEMPGEEWKQLFNLWSDSKGREAGVEVMRLLQSAMAQNGLEPQEGHIPRAIVSEQGMETAWMDIPELGEEGSEEEEGQGDADMVHNIKVLCRSLDMLREGCNLSEAEWNSVSSDMQAQLRLIKK